MPHKKCLILHQGALGDLVLAFPVIRSIKKRYGRTEGLVPSSNGLLAKHLGILDYVHPLESSRFATLWSDIPSEEVLSFCRGFNEIVLFSFSEALKTSLLSGTGLSVIRIDPRPSPELRIHVTDFLSRQLAKNGRFPASSSELRKIPPLSAPEKIRRVILHPGSGSRRKNWPLTHFVSVAEKLEKVGLEPVFLLGPAERSLASELKQTGLPVYGPSSPADLADFLRTANKYLGNDSGVSHLAAFLGLRVATVFGPSDPVRWRPLGISDVIRPDDLPCAPCFETERENCPEVTCLHQTQLDDVFVQAASLWE